MGKLLISEEILLKHGFTLINDEYYKGTHYIRRKFVVTKEENEITKDTMWLLNEYHRYHCIAAPVYMDQLESIISIIEESDVLWEERQQKQIAIKQMKAMKRSYSTIAFIIVIAWLIIGFCDDGIERRISFLYANLWAVATLVFDNLEKKDRQ